MGKTLKDRKEKEYSTRKCKKFREKRKKNIVLPRNVRYQDIIEEYE